MKTTDEIFVPYKLAKELYEAGFDQKSCIATIDQIEYIHIKGTRSTPRGAMCYDEIGCPLWQQAFDFMMDKHKMYLSADHRMNGDVKNYWYCIKQFNESPSGFFVVAGLIQVGCHKTDIDAKTRALTLMLNLI